MLTLKATAVWLVILVCAALNGGLREALLIPSLGKTLALVVSGTLLSIVIVALALLLVPRLGRLGTSHCLYLVVTFAAPLLAVRVRGKPAQ
jgi:hypothetical protein